MRRGSIAFNIFAFSAVWLVLALAATSYLLTELYSRALDTSLVETLEFHLGSLVGAALDQETAQLNEFGLADPRFSRPASGWYWQVVDADGTVQSFSSSLVGSMLPEIANVGSLDERSITTARDAFGTQVRLVQRDINLDGTVYQFTVSGNLDEVIALVDDFRGQTITVLGAIGVMLAMMSALVGRFALRPVTRLRKSLEDVREGENDSVVGNYPIELQPLADEVNELLRSNTEIVDRARSQVGNLAHGLKTPLAVLRNEAAGKRTALADIVMSESQKMSETVATYLDRARLSARTAVVGKRANAAEVITRLVRVMGKIHAGRSIELSMTAAKMPWFRGEEADLEEVIGNLLDNACKWAKGSVWVAAEGDVGSGGTLKISIDDDGPGLDEADIEKAIKRGVRLDEKTPGSGLGLDIVKELVDVYGGTLVLGKSDRGGLKVQVRLPSARSG